MYMGVVAIQLLPQLPPQILLSLILPKLLLRVYINMTMKTSLPFKWSIVLWYHLLLIFQIIIVSCFTLSWFCVLCVCCFLCSVQFSCSVVSDSLWPHGLQHARPPCPSPTPGAYSNSCPSRRWCHPTTSSSAVPFSSRLQSFPASGSFQLSQFFVSGGQSIGVSASVRSMTIQNWFPLGLTGWISLQSNGLSRVFSKTQFKSINSSVLSFLYSPTLTSIHDYWKNHSFDQMDLCLCFLICCLGCSQLFFQGASVF